MNMLVLIVGVMAHFFTTRTEGSAVTVKPQSSAFELRESLFTFMSKRNNGNNLFFLKVVVMSVRVVVSVTAEVADMDVQSIFMSSFLESVKSVKGQSKVTFISAGL
jgi:hypothetical protein